MPTGARTGRVSLCRALQITLKHRGVDRRGVGGPRPQRLAAESHIVGRLVLRLNAMGSGIGKRIGGRLADDDADLSANVAGHAHVTGNVIGAYSHTVARLEMLARSDVGAPCHARCGAGKASMCEGIESLVRDA